MKKLIIPTVLLLGVAIFAIAQNLNEVAWRAMPERNLTLNDNRTATVSNLWEQVENQATNTRLNYLVIRRPSESVFTLDAGEDKVVKLVEVP